jgi:uncharacterized membrane protein
MHTLASTPHEPPSEARRALTLTQAEAAARAVARRRWAALDLFRFLAVILMVQGHAFYVTTSDAVRSAAWYRWHNYVHGFTAPMFLFAAGLAFAITTFRRWEEHRVPGRPVAKRLERYLLLLAIGYALQIPGLSLGRLFAPESPGELARILKIDALHHIGLVLLMMELSVLVLQRRARLAMLAGAGGLAAVLAAPAVWRWPADERLPTFLAAWVNDTTGSIFPIVPWCGFICAGVVTGYLVSRCRDEGWQERLPGRLAVASGVLLATAFLLDRAFPGEQLFGPHNFWKTSPWFFLWRLGVVLLVLGAVGLLEGAVRRQAKAPTIRLLQVMGQETLVVYVAHLLVLYGSPVFVGVWAIWRHALGLPASTAVFAALFAAMAALAWGWHRLKVARPRAFQSLRLGLLAVTVLILLLPRW